MRGRRAGGERRALPAFPLLALALLAVPRLPAATSLHSLVERRRAEVKLPDGRTVHIGRTRVLVSAGHLREAGAIEWGRHLCQTWGAPAPGEGCRLQEVRDRGYCAFVRSSHPRQAFLDLEVGACAGSPEEAVVLARRRCQDALGPGLAGEGECALLALVADLPGDASDRAPAGWNPLAPVRPLGDTTKQSPHRWLGWADAESLRSERFAGFEPRPAMLAPTLEPEPEPTEADPEPGPSATAWIPEAAGTRPEAAPPGPRTGTGEAPVAVPAGSRGEPRTRVAEVTPAPGSPGTAPRSEAEAKRLRLAALMASILGDSGPSQPASAPDASPRPEPAPGTASVPGPTSDPTPAAVAAPPEPASPAATPESPPLATPSPVQPTTPGPTPTPGDRRRRTRALIDSILGGRK